MTPKIKTAQDAEKVLNEIIQEMLSDFLKSTPKSILQYVIITANIEENDRTKSIIADDCDCCLCYFAEFKIQLNGQEQSFNAVFFDDERIKQNYNNEAVKFSKHIADANSHTTDGLYVNSNDSTFIKRTYSQKSLNEIAEFLNRTCDEFCITV